MRHSFLIVCAAMLTLSPAVKAQQSSNDLAVAEREIRPLLQEMLAAANAHDTDRHLAMYLRSPDLVFIANDEAFDSLRVRQRQWWQDGKSDVVYELVGTPEYRMAAPGVAIQMYFLKSTRVVGAGPARTLSFGVTAVWRKRPEGWRIIYAHESIVTR